MPKRTYIDTCLLIAAFCGTAGERLIDLWDKFDAGHIAHVHCEKCGADGPSIYSEQDADTAIKRARWAWNGRSQTLPATRDHGA